MNIAGSAESIAKVARLITVLVIVNFVLLLVSLGPGRNHNIDLALRNAGVEDLIGRLWQVWTIASTLVASVLFAIVLWRRRNTPELKAVSSTVGLEGVLLLAWWATICGLLTYGLVLGTSG